MTSDAAAAVEAWVAGQPDLAVEREGDTWRTVLAGERKRTVPVQLSLGEHTLTGASFFVRAPDENAAEVYGLLLHRNLRTYLWRFALDDAGDIWLVAVVPLHAVTTDEVDRLLGQLLVAADETFDTALRAGFGTYIAAEQAWREKVGAPRNPIT